MPRLDQRLRTVASLVRTDRHADVGSDHGYLLKYLLCTHRIRFGIAIENKHSPFENSRATLKDMNAAVRMGDAFEALAIGEVDSVSVCGMGGEQIVRILERFPQRVPQTVVVQPNRKIDRVRAWGLDNGFHLTEEIRLFDHGDFEILKFHKATDVEGDRGDDPIYAGLDRSTALQLGPHHLRRRDQRLRQRLREEDAYLRQFKQLTVQSRTRQKAITHALRCFDQP
jgi:tRNA (adenine22-N1)-methyltransferase